ncbi:MAG TPA: orotidine-5'-phosphate decarboxylase [Tissierellaceae bacterium]|nr:orotidine-5'-phosphate decarboxylase [Tissierellaceae bacterium]
MIIDRLYDEVEKKGPVCVGLDSRLAHIPSWIKEKYQDLDEIIFQFNKKIIDATEDLVAIYKPQIAFYEAYGIKGLLAYSRTLEYIRKKQLLSIGDIKRGDISSTAVMYGRAHFQGDFEADFITLNPYMGFDSITPYLKYLDTGKKGIFVLLRTSNPGAKDIEYLKANNKRIYYHVGDKLEEIGRSYIGSRGYSLIGAVVGGTYREEAEEIRERYKNMFFLIPGYGAQGASGGDVNLYLEKGNGGVVNSSRGIIRSYKNYGDGEKNFQKYTRQAVEEMIKDIRQD